MAKKKEIIKTRRTIIHCPEYVGYLDEMPQEAKDRLIERNPKAGQLFKNWVAPTPAEPIVE